MRNRNRLATVSFAAMLVLLLSSPGAVRAEGDASAAKRDPDVSQIAETAPAPPMDTWHAATFVSGRMGLRLIQYWSKGSWMRAETLIGGHPIVTIVHGEDYIAFDRLTGKGAKIRRSPAAIQEDAGRSRPFGNDWEELVADGAVKVEDSTRAGQSVEIWRITDDSGRRKLWLTSEEPKLPMRLENFVRASADTITTDYSNWAKGLQIPDAFFDAPSNIALESLDYAGYVEASSERSIGPVLYPDMLHGSNIP